MQEIYQKTISNSVQLEGVGLHSGKTSNIKILPANEDHGIVFKRIDLKKNNLIKAKYSNVSSTKLCTTLKNEHGAQVSTVEHLLASLYCVGIDNVLIEINCSEVPIMDGSAKDFLDVFRTVKIVSQTKKRKYLKVTKKIEFVDDGRLISLEPSDSSFEVEFELNYENKIIGKQKNKVNFSENDLSDVVNSRTFCLYSDIEKIKKAGLAKGGSLDNAVVIDKDKVLNKDGLRNQKEFVNHKILDLAGDFFLSGHRILGKVKCSQGGHGLTNTFLRKILANSSFMKFFEVNDAFVNKKIKSDNDLKLAVNA